MASVLRVLLWTAVIIAPGGFILAPVLIAHSAHQRKRAKSAV
jgi:hypothetical protein